MALRRYRRLGFGSADGERRVNNVRLAAVEGTLVPIADEIRSYICMHGVTHVAAIPQAGGAANGRYFGTDCEAGLAFALATNRDRHNVYFTANAPKPDCGHKPSKLQFDWLRCAFVDIDPPRDGGAFDKALAIELVRADCPRVLIDSGNGIQALWYFAEQLVATSENIAAVETLNKAIVAKFGGDRSRTNIDSLLRLPGTVNWPNARKRARGYVPCMAHVL